MFDSEKLLLGSVSDIFSVLDLFIVSVYSVSVQSSPEAISIK